MGTPSSAGVELNLALQRLSGKPLTEIDKYAETELGVRLDYFLLFRWLSSPPSDGYEPAYESELVQIYANETP